MNSYINTIFLIFLLCLCVGCKPDQTSAPETIQKDSKVEKGDSAELEMAEPVVDMPAWIGTYTGTIPCDHCEGITVWLKLNPDETFEFRTSYLGLNDARDEIFTGKFIWEKGQSQISLKGLIGGYPGKFNLEENRAWYLDENGNVPQGKNRENYRLEKWWD